MGWINGKIRWASDDTHQQWEGVVGERENRKSTLEPFVTDPT